MIKGGVTTVFVSEMDRAVSFYTDVLGLKLLERYGDHWAEVSVGNGMVIGLHPVSQRAPAPGTSGSISIGMNVSMPLDTVVSRLQEKGVRFRGPIVADENAGIRLAFFGDPDGNDLYLCETGSPAQ